MVEVKSKIISAYSDLFEECINDYANQASKHNYPNKSVIKVITRKSRIKKNPIRSYQVENR